MACRSVVVAVVAAALVVNAAEVRGESAPADAARDAVAQARQASDAGRLPEAIEAYKRAYELSGDTDLLFQLGELNRRLGQDVAAIRFYRTYLARDLRGKYHEAAERAARALESKPSKPAPAGAPAADVVVPAPVAPPPAPALSAPAAPPAPVVAAPAPVAPVSGSVVAAPAGAPASPPTAAATPGADLRADVTSAHQPPSRTPLPGWLPWAGLGATVALAAGATVAGLQANHRYDQLKTSCARTAEGCPAADISEVKSRALVANVLWAATGVCALATGVFVVVNAREVGFGGAWSF